MPFLRSLPLLLALVAPAFGQDGPHDAANAKDAAQALKLYLDEVSKSGGRPDYTNAPGSDLFHRLFNAGELATLPPAQASDMAWLREWTGAANQTIKLLLLFGAKPGPDLDQAATARNLVEYEDQYAAATDFLIRIEARQAAALSLFMGQLTPEQHTPTRECGLRLARDGAAKLISHAIISVSEGAKPANARLVTAAIRDTRDVWAAFILPDDRTRMVNMIRTNTPKPVKDPEVQRNLAACAASFAAK